MATALHHVNQPLRLGPVEVANRIFFPAHSTNFAERLSSRRLAEYYAERAQAGVGLVIHEPVIVHLSSLSRPTKVWGFDPENVPPYRRAAALVHEAGAVFFCQLLHNGAHMSSYFTDGPLWAPSPAYDAQAGEMAHEMTTDEIAQVVDGFARSAELCREGGFDGVELHGSHGYLIQQFLSPLTNRRSDDYGGDQAGRRRFLDEIVAAVRRRVGDDFVVGLRMAGDERAPGGLTPADAGALAAELEAGGQIDYVNISTGGAAAPGWIVLDATYERGANLDAAAAVRSATGLPVLVAGRVVTPAEAEAALAAGQADMIGVARALMADPQWLAKARDGRPDAIRPCTYCNECIAGIGAFRPIGCTANPDLGHEAEAGALGVAPRPARVVVVGGGVAGMEAALVAAGRGHRVVLVEASDRLGGQLAQAFTSPMRRELGHLPEHLAQALPGAGVEVRLGSAATAEAVLGLEPDHVVVATGSRSPAPPPGTLSATEVLAGPATVGHRVLVWSAGGHPWELDEVAEQLVARDHEVVVAVAAGGLAGRGTDYGLAARLAAGRVEVRTWAAPTGEWSRGPAGIEVTFRHPVTGDTWTEAGFDDLVVATNRQADDGLARALAGQVAVQVVGDALAPRTVRDAVWEARAAARRVGTDEVR